MAESGGNPNAHNKVPPDDSYGLWQINMIGKLGPARRAAYGLKRNADLFDPETNARVMSEISKNGRDFTPWSTFTNGAYKRYTDGKEHDPDAGLQWDDIPGLGAVNDTADAVGSAVDMGQKTAVWISDAQNWIRVAYVVGGGAVVLLGLSMVIRSTPAGRQVQKTATKVAKVAVTKKVTK